MIWLIGAGLLVLVVFLFIPVKLVLRITGQESFFWMTEVTWLGGVLCIRRDSNGSYFAITGWWRRMGDRGSPALVQPTSNKTKTWLQIWRETSSRNRTAFLRLLHDIWHSFNLNFNGAGHFGFEDPAVTSWVQAVIWVYGGKLNLQPDFTQPGLRGKVEITCNVKPFSVIVPLLRFGTTLAMNLIRQKYRGGQEIWQR